MKFRYTILGFLTFFLITFLTPLSYYASAAPAVTIEVTAGYNGAVKGGRYVPLHISLLNQQEQEFEGSLQILSMETDYEIYRYDYPIHLDIKASEQKTVNIPLRNRADQLYVILKDSEGREVIRKRLKLEISMDVAELLIGVLSDTPQQLQYMDGVGINYSTIKTRTATLSAEMMPTEVAGLDLFDVILITNYDANKLSEEQRETILEWVSKGGALILGTGERVHDTLGPFSEGLVDEPYGDASMVSIDMGVEYATNGPGDSFIDLPCVDISLHGGNAILANDGLPVLTAVPREKGKIAIAAYDFIDIAQFCQNRRTYVEKIFINLFGEEKINRLSDTVYSGASDRYWSVQSVINTGNVDKLPNITFYLCIIILYLIVIGPGLYVWLKKKNKRHHYRTAVIVSAVCFTVIIYLLGNKTRFQNTFFTYATIQDVSEQSIAESTIVNMRTPYNKPYQVELESGYSVLPITRNYYYDRKGIPMFTGAEDYKVGIEYQEDETIISVQDVVAFSPRYFQLERKTDNVKEVGVTGSISLADGLVYGSITNNFDYALENTAVLFYGQMILVDSMKPGETKILDGKELIFVPLGYSQLVAEHISGGSKYQKADIRDKDYIQSLERTNLLRYYLDNYRASYTSDARVVAFSEQKEKEGLFKHRSYETYGSTMLTSEIKVQQSADRHCYRSALMKVPTVISGSYSKERNTMYGTDILILEYSLGNDIEVEAVSFHTPSTLLMDNEKYKYINPYKGNLYFYNYDSNSYDAMGTNITEFDQVALSSYLSPSNTLTIKYVPENSSEYTSEIILPMLMIAGREK